MKKNNNNNFLIGLILFVICVFIISFVLLVGCGTSPSPTPTPTTNYTLQGKVGTISGSGLGARAATSVTHIVAIGSNLEKYLATPEADGTFSLPIIKGYPYVLGFYNKTGTTITLLGYLKQSDVNWHSLPIMNPTDSSTDLGTIEINSTSQEATPSINVTSLIGKMNMDLTTAQYYGTFDESLIVLTNLDVDGNGIFDFSENKAYMFHTFLGMGPGNSNPGEISKMLGGNYNDTFKPKPAYYEMVFICNVSDGQTSTTTMSMVGPKTFYSSTTNFSNTLTGTIDVSSFGWSCFMDIGNNALISPEVAPSGTYVATAGAKTYTINNFQGSSVVAINSTNGIIYPVFNLVTNEAGYITTVNYKWKKLVNNVITTPSAAEIKAAIESTITQTAFAHTSPFISFFTAAQDPSATPILFDRDGTSVDVSSYNVKLSTLHHIQASYNLTSRVVCKFEFGN